MTYRPEGFSEVIFKERYAFQALRIIVANTSVEKMREMESKKTGFLFWILEFFSFILLPFILLFDWMKSKSNYDSTVITFS